MEKIVITNMSLSEFIENVKNYIGCPDTREKRITLKSLPYFQKWEAPHLPTNMVLHDWWDAFNEYMSANLE